MLKEHTENQKLVVSQQSGIIKGLQQVLESTLNQGTKAKDGTGHDAIALKES